MNIIELAKQAGFQDANWNYIKCLAKFADLVAAQEREACAKFFDDNDINLFWGSQVARHIRARGTI